MSRKSEARIKKIRRFMKAVEKLIVEHGLFSVEDPDVCVVSYKNTLDVVYVKLHHEDPKLSDQETEDEMYRLALEAGGGDW